MWCVERERTLTEKGGNAISAWQSSLSIYCCSATGNTCLEDNSTLSDNNHKGAAGRIRDFLFICL